MSAATSTSAMATSHHHRRRLLPVGYHHSATYNKHMNMTNYFLGNTQGLSINFKQRARSSNMIRKKMDMTVYAGILPGIPLPSSDNWKGWVLGVLLSMVLPLLKYKSPFLALKHEVVKVVVSIDTVAEIIEKVAEGVEKVADEVADHLPEGKLKEAARCLESIAHETAKDAHIADEFLDKMVEVGDEMEKGMVECAKQQEVVVTATTPITTDVVQVKEEATIEQEIVISTATTIDVIQVKEEATKEDQSNSSTE